MNTLKLILLSIFFITSSTQAQVSVNVNLGTPPVWAPVSKVQSQYYYLPDVDAYYDVPSEQFIYVKNGVWIRSRALPARYNTYNLKKGRVIFLTDYKGKSPYVYHKKHKVKYHTTTYVSKNRKVVVVNNKNNGKGYGHAKAKGKGHSKGHGKGKKD